MTNEINMKDKLSGLNSFKGIELYCWECGAIQKADVPMYAKYMRCQICKSQRVFATPNKKFEDQVANEKKFRGGL